MNNPEAICAKCKCPKTLLYVHETTIGSVISDTFTWLMVMSLIGIGWWLKSSAMQWCGFLMFAVTVMAKGSGKTKKISPQEAADKLLAEFGVRAAK